MSNDGKMHIDILSDEEYYAMEQKRRKAEILDNLLNIGESKTKSFSMKNVKSKSEKSELMATGTDGPVKKGTELSLIDMTTKKDEDPLSDEEWENLVASFSDVDDSPIETITDERMGGFALTEFMAEPDDRYANMFKKEIAMLSEILKETSGQTKILNKKLKDLTGKTSYSGVSKYYSDMLESYTGLTSAKLNIIKTMADLRSKQEDFKLKSKKDSMGDEQSTDALVDQFYSKIISGGRSNFVEQSMSPYNAIPQNGQPTNLSSGDSSIDMGYDVSSTPERFNITQMDSYDSDGNVTGSDDVAVDPYGYISNEKNRVDICVQRFSNGECAFIALDEDGNTVDRYELPGDDLLEDLEIKPYSNYATDKFQRRYRIIDVNTDGVPLDDLDDNEYPGYDNSSRE